MNKIDVLDYYLNLGEKGIFPLFFKDWIVNIDFENEEGSDVDLQEFFKKMKQYKHLDKKKLVISAMNQKDREKLIHEFFHQIDVRISKNKYNFH